MNRMLALLAFGSLAVSLRAADVNLTIQSKGGSAIEVAPGAEVHYQVIGQLSDLDNEGLALFAFDLAFSGGALPQADPPAAEPLTHFANDLGINNPAGFGGTLIEGRLVQVGGGQNTIKNTIEYAPYPVGEVITGVGHEPTVLASGMLIAPLKPGTYTLEADNVVANVIKAGEDGLGEFWAVEAAPQGDVVPLSIEVLDQVPALLSSTPPNGAIDARQPSDVNGNNPGGWDSIILHFSGDASGLTAADFEVSALRGTAPAIAEVVIDGADVTLQLDGFIPVGTWTTFSYTAGGSARLGFLPADVNGDRTSGPLDILAVIDGLNGVVNLQPWQGDANRSGQSEPSDILAVIDLLNGAGAHEVWNGRTLPK